MTTTHGAMLGATLWVMLWTAASSRVAAAQRDTTTPPPVQLPTVQVTVTRDSRRSPLDLPYAITVARPDSARPGQRHLGLDETLLLLPGVAIANRTNPTQDPRISIRGFGARSAFGVRGVRVLRDGMPLTLPDGQTPVDYLDLESVGSVEVIRGSASAIYGNAAGGVIDLRSADPPRDPVALSLRGWDGSNDLRRWTAAVGGTTGVLRYQATAVHTTSDGSRAFSRQEITSGFGRVMARTGGTDLSLEALLFSEPVAQNPGALTAAQLARNPRQADPASIQKGARKAVRQGQIGLTAAHALAGGDATLTFYGGWRSLENPLAFAVVDVDRTSYGASARGTVPFTLLGRATLVTLGADVQRQNDGRHEWVNCNNFPAPRTSGAACPTPGAERGVSSKAQDELVTSAGPFVRAEMEVAPRVRVSAGVRADYVRFEVRDHLVTGTNPDDSGERLLHAVSPTVGAVARVGQLTSVYVTLSSSFETPTATELGNKPDGSAGINPTLKPQYATTYETGVKGVLFGRMPYDLAGFRTRTRDELIPYEVVGTAGRRYYRNAGRTERRGIELGMTGQAGPVQLAAAYSYAAYHFTDFVALRVDYRGKRIPGIPIQTAEASATVRGRGMFATVEGIAAGSVYVDDANSARAGSYTIANLRVGGAAAFGKPWLAPVLGVQNLFDRGYVGSVSVNAAGGKYFEPASGRSLFVGLTAAVGR